MQICLLGHDYLIECETCKLIDRIIENPIFKKNEDILLRYLKTGEKSVLDELCYRQT